MKIKIQGFDSWEIVDVKTGFISRERNGTLFVTGSNSWVCTGAVWVNRFGNISASMTVEEFAHRIRKDKASLYYKNGKAKFRITDIDHGTRRIWGNTPKHWGLHVE